MLTRWRAVRTRPAAGAAMVEVAAAWGIAALVIAAIVLGVQGANIGAYTTRVLCTIMTSVGGGGSCGDSDEQEPPTEQPPFDPKPTKCKITERAEKVNSEIKIAFIKFGENAGFIQATYSDGTVTYTATNGASLGLTGGVGGKMDIGELERGAKVDFGGGFKVDYGSTWVFKDRTRPTPCGTSWTSTSCSRRCSGTTPTAATPSGSGSPAASSTRRSRPARTSAASPWKAM